MNFFLPTSTESNEVSQVKMETQCDVDVINAGTESCPVVLEKDAEFLLPDLALKSDDEHESEIDGETRIHGVENMSRAVRSVGSEEIRRKCRLRKDSQRAKYLVKLHSTKYRSGSVIRYKFSCKLCHETSITDPYSHQKTHTEGSKFRCKFCTEPVWFSRIHKFRRHLELTHPNQLQERQARGNKNSVLRKLLNNSISHDSAKRKFRFLCDKN